MKNFSQAGIVLCLMAFFSSCATLYSTEKSEEAKKYDAMKASPEFQQEKETFKRRMGGKLLCPEIGVAELLSRDDIAPSKNCLYPPSSYAVEARTLKQRLKSLKVLQVGPNGFLVNAEYPYFNGYRWSTRTSDRVAFIRKGEEEGVVDGAYLDIAYDFALYEYTGVYQYERVIGGSNTVHSFRKVPLKEITEARKGLKLYSGFKEYFIENRLWDWVEKLEQQADPLSADK